MWDIHGGNPLNLFDQILLKLYSIIILLATLFLIVFGFGFFENMATEFIMLISETLEARIIFLIVVIVIALISLRFLILGGRKNSAAPTINTRNDLGETRTSITTFEAIASQTVQKIIGVRESQVRLKVSEVEGHQFFIKVVIDGDVPIPQITEQIQREVKSRVEEITGVGIQQVSVLVSDVVSSGPTKPRRVE